MRHITHILVAILVLLTASERMSAQTRRQKRDSGRDFIYLSTSLAAQGLMANTPELKSKAGAAVSLGFGYRGYRNHFIYSVGLEGRYGNYNLEVPGLESAMTGLYDMDGHFGLPGEPYTLHAILGSRTEYMHAAQLQVPLLIGGEWGHWYFMAGAKGDFSLYGSALSRTTITSTATYTRYDAVLQDMPNHGLFSNQELKSERQRVSLMPQVSVLAEFGYRLGEVYTANGADIPYAKTRYYIALFGEYGLLDMHKSTGDAAAVQMTVDGQGNLGCYITPALNTFTYKDVAIQNWVVGVKFTVAFELPKTKICVICKEREQRNRW